MAEEARDQAANSTDYESNARANLVGFMNEFIADLNDGSSGGGTEEPVQTATTVTEAKENKLPFSEKTVITDEKQNRITIPKGFKIAGDSGNTVQQGIVIEDVSASKDSEVQGSQYVWIPVGTFVKDDGSTSNEIKLGRYTFDSSGNTIAPLQYAGNYTESVIIKDYLGYDCTETTTYDEGKESMGTDGRNATAKNLEEFVNSTKPIEEGGNGGYYIGRYEASYASGATSTTTVGNYANCKAASKISNGYSKTSTKVAISTYADSTSVKSDLMNSYAWDTAIVYIQEAGNSNYANQNSKNTTLANTGTNNDEVCKINDMASNIYEWTTEHSSGGYGSFSFPCVVRGGNCSGNADYTAVRYSLFATNDSGESLYGYGFRICLYVN